MIKKKETKANKKQCKRSKKKGIRESERVKGKSQNFAFAFCTCSNFTRLQSALLLNSVLGSFGSFWPDSDQQPA